MIQEFNKWVNNFITDSTNVSPVKYILVLFLLSLQWFFASWIPFSICFICLCNSFIFTSLDPLTKDVQFFQLHRFVCRCHCKICPVNSTPDLRKRVRRLLRIIPHFELEGSPKICHYLCWQMFHLWLRKICLAALDPTVLLQAFPTAFSISLPPQLQTSLAPRKYCFSSADLVMTFTIK